MALRIRPRERTNVSEPQIVRLLLEDPRAGWLWLLPRLWVGWAWLIAGARKLADAEWVQTGVAIRTYWQRQVALPETGSPPVAFDWYRSFLQLLIDANAHTWMAKLVVLSEVIVGVALILGAFTAIAAFGGAFLNWNFMMAGSASTNPMLFAFSIGLILAWKVAGYVGADYFLLPWLNTPWQRAGRPPSPNRRNTRHSQG